jgi:predicted dehydrogenase
MVRLGLIGCGEHAEIGHARPLARYKAAHPDEIVLAGACDKQLQRAQRFCAKYGFQSAYSDADEMLSRETLDGCIAVVPPEAISALGIHLLNRGVPCVVEKPLGSSLTEVTVLRDAAASSRTPNMVSVNRRFMPFLNRALEWSRAAGPIRYIHCTLARHSRAEPEFIWATAVHAVDTLRYIAGDLADFDARHLKAAHASAAWYTIDLDFKKGSTGRIDILPTAGVAEETYDLFCDGFRVSVTCPFGPQLGWRAFRDGVLIAGEIASGQPEDVLNGCFDEAAAFIHALSGASAPQPSIADVAPSVELCMTIAGK